MGRPKNSKLKSAVFFVGLSFVTRSHSRSPKVSQLKEPIKSATGFEHLAPDIKKIVERGRLIVATTKADQPPFVFTNVRGELNGIDIDIAKDIADNLGVTLEVNRESITSDAVIKLLSRDRADLALAKLSTNLKWGVSVRFSNPYLVLEQARLVNRLKKTKWVYRNPFGSALDSKASKKMIGVIQGSAYPYFAEKYFGQFFQVPYLSNEKMFGDVLHGDIDAALTDSRSVRSWFKSHPEYGIYVETELLAEHKDPIAIALPWASTQLLAWTNLYLDESDRSGQLNRILSDYFDGTGGTLNAQSQR